MIPTRQPLMPTAPAIYPCPKCGQTMRNGFVCLGEERTPTSVEGMVVRTVAAVAKGAAKVIGAPGPSLEFSAVGQPRVHVMEAGTVPTAYRCDACGVVAIFAVKYEEAGHGPMDDPRRDDDGPMG